MLTIRLGGHFDMVPITNGVAIHGADNYAEIEIRGGRRLVRGGEP